MLPQYAERQLGGEIAIWLLLTVGALLIPIIIIGICCIRRHLARRPRIQLMESRSPRMMMNTKQEEVLRSYNGPYVEPNMDDVGISTPTISRTNSLKKQHVHWPDGSTKPRIDNFYSKKDQQFSSRKQLFSGEDILNTTMLTESPSVHRRSDINPATSLALSHFIQTAIIPVGSTIGNTGTSTSHSTGFNSIV